MSDWIIVPVVLPALMAAFQVLALRTDPVLQRVFSIAACIVLLGVAVGLWLLAGDGTIRPYRLGDWPAPYGIVLVLDRLSALMLLMTAVLSVIVVLYAVTSGWDRKGWHFHALFQFQLMGVNGAFLTGDVFNLFVFFEVLLIASYGLALHGGGARRLGAGLHYVVLNLVGSTLFLVAVSLIYAVTGTLNMADLAVKVASVRQEDVTLLATGGLLLLLVFALKASLVPLHWWLPGTYSAVSAPVAALFAIMTKVGAYSILRVYTLIFGADAGATAWLAAPWVTPAALMTLLLGAVGVLAARDLLTLACFATIASMGTLLIALGLFDPAGLTAGLYYVVHSTLTTALLFLLVELIARRRTDGTSITPGALLGGREILGGYFFLAAIAAVGLPPLSGFVGKLLVLSSAEGTAQWSRVWVVVLVSSLLLLIGFARSGSDLFWKGGEKPSGEPGTPEGGSVQLWLTGTVAGMLVLLTLLAGPATRIAAEVAAQLLAPQHYVAAVLGADAAARLAER